jgi:hypothetical protein
MFPPPRLAEFVFIVVIMGLPILDADDDDGIAPEDDMFDEGTLLLLPPTIASIAMGEGAL